MKTIFLLLIVALIFPEVVRSQTESDSAAIIKTLDSWNQGWVQADAALAVQDYADDVDWTNAFGDRFQGRDALQKGLEFIFSLDFVMAENSGGNEFENVIFLTPDVAMLRSKLVRAGQKTSTGETMPDRHIHHLRVLQRRAGKWQIVSHLISQSHEKSKPTDKGKGKPSESDGDVRLPIIDVHVYAEDERWTYKVPNPVTGQTITATTEQAHMQATLAEMKKYNVVKAVVSNDYPTVQRWKSTFPEQIINSFGFNDPTTLDVAFLRKEHAAGRLEALGEIGTQYLGIAPNHPRLDPVYALAEELDIPVSIHVGLTKPGGIYGDYPNYRAAIGNPMLLEEVLIRHPKLRINVMHAGWPMSDQMVWPEAIGMAVEGIESATFLTEQQKRDIFYNNAVDFYRLDKK